MNALDTIKELIDELGAEEVLFTRAKGGDGPPIPAVTCRQALPDTKQGLPPRIVHHQLVRSSFKECIEELISDARQEVAISAKKKKAEPAPGNVVALS